MREELKRLEHRKAELTDLLARETAPEPSLHPAMAELYREAIANLREGPKDPITKDEAFSIIRTLIEAVILVPEGTELKVELRGALVGILRLASGAGTIKAPARVHRGLFLLLFWRRKSRWMRVHETTESWHCGAPADRSFGSCALTAPMRVATSIFNARVLTTLTSQRSRFL